MVFATPLVSVSCTGTGELFLRHVVAHDVAARMLYKKVGVGEAAREAGEGGVRVKLCKRTEGCSKERRHRGRCVKTHGGARSQGHGLRFD